MTPTFSQRRGITPLEKELQDDFIDDDLKNSIWNIIQRNCFNYSSDYLYSSYDRSTRVGKYVNNLWEFHFKIPIDKIPDSLKYVLESIRDTFFAMPYNEIYDFIEYLSENYPFTSNSDAVFVEELNHVFEREFCAYRLISNAITEITSAEEISEIEEATQTPLSSVNQHIQRGLTHLSNRKNPDYPNSIKESISAVESLCKKITGNENATMGRALNEIETQGTIELHEDMKEAFKKPRQKLLGQTTLFIIVPR